jgi:hypothetical protein
VTRERETAIERFVRLDALGSLLTYLEASHGWGGGPLLDNELRDEIFDETYPPHVRALSLELVDSLWPAQTDRETPEFVLATTRSALLSAAILQQLAQHPDRLMDVAQAMTRRAEHDLRSLQQ